MGASPTKVLEFAKAADEAMSAAQNLLDKVATEKSAAMKSAKAISASLVDCRLIAESERNSAIEKLSDHNGALEVVGNLLTLLQQEKTATQQKLAAAGSGSPVPGTEKAGSNGSAYGGFSDRPLGLGQKSPADIAFERQFGLK